MNNPIMAIMQMMRGGGNPQAMLQQMMNNSQVASNPIMKNALNMAQNGDMKGVENLARNLCKEKGINADEAVNQIKQQFGMK